LHIERGDLLDILEHRTPTGARERSLLHKYASGRLKEI
jgi:hypothetical protein